MYIGILDFLHVLEVLHFELLLHDLERVQQFLGGVELLVYSESDDLVVSLLSNGYI